MGRQVRLACFVAAAMLFSLPVFSQDRTRPGAGGGGSANRAPVASPGMRTAAPTVSSRPVAGTSYGVSGTYSNPANRGFSASGYNAPAPFARNIPTLQGTSFYSTSQYYYWSDFLYHLRSRYWLDNMYFNRFYRNSEPLLTPRMQKLVVRDPLMLSRQMLASIDDLSAMLEARDAGQPVDSDLIIAKTREIREMAKKIRGDDLLPYVDQRKEINMLKGQDVKSLGLSAVQNLREMTLDLNTQLRNLYNDTSTATVSVNELNQPSFSSLSKGIEQLCKVIESSAKKI
jgi:hypothetical protein